MPGRLDPAGTDDAAALSEGDAGLAAALGELGVGVALLDEGGRPVFASSELRRMLPAPETTGSVDALAEVLAAGRADLDRVAATTVSVQDHRQLRIRTSRTGWVVCEQVGETGVEPTGPRRDPLTELADRAAFRELLDRQVRDAGGAEVAVLYLDLDHFKTVNDTLGHPAGDELLRQVAQRLRSAVRPEDLVGRLGGDEFAVVQVGTAQPAGAVALARRLNEAVARTYDISGHRVDTATSVGIAIHPWDGLTPDELVKHADLALYAAKRGGRGGHRLYEPKMSQAMHARRDLEQDLRTALHEDALELHYQPQVSVHDRRVQSVEALLRWTHPQRGSIGPAEFIPIAEDSGLILELGRWVLTRACTEAASWPVPVPVAVNVSPAQLHKRTLVRDVGDALRISGLDPTRLELEITEGVLISDTDYTLRVLNELKSRGVRFSMDDFGTGYSSLSYLRTFPFDKLKIDRSFVQEATSDGDNCAIIRAVATMGQSLGMTTVAEGVETDSQLDALRREGCDQIQGYLISRPQPAALIPQLLRDHYPPVSAAPMPRQPSGEIPCSSV